MNFVCRSTPLNGLAIIESRIFKDSRGGFLETHNQKAFAEMGIDVSFVQDNQSVSGKGVLRGLHFQMRHPQAKLVRVVQGQAFDVAVDLRRNSPTLGRWFGVVLDGQAQNLFYIPVGFAHGFLALTDGVIFSYKCSDYYHPEDEGGIRWDDADLGIEWPILGQGGQGSPLVSPKDQQLPLLKQCDFRF